LQAKLPALTFGDERRGLHALRDHFPFLFGNRCVDVQCEIVNVATEHGDHEVHLVLHKPSDEVDVPRQSVEPRDNEWTTRGARLLKSGSKAWSQQDCVSSSARLNILMPGCDGESFAHSEMLNVETLRSKSQSAATLFLGAALK
jgi:hypothetical protein